MTTVKLGASMDKDTAEKVLKIYREAYPECRISEDADGQVVYTYPECPMVLNKDKPGAMNAYFHACDVNAYRAALRALRRPPIMCVAVKPQGDKRPVKPAAQKVLNEVF